MTCCCVVEKSLLLRVGQLACKVVGAVVRPKKRHVLKISSNHHVLHCSPYVLEPEPHANPDQDFNLKSNIQHNLIKYSYKFSKLLCLTLIVNLLTGR
jgi:hypothetical protein